MTKSKLTTLVASALVVGLTVGTLGIANAAVHHQPRHRASVQARAYTAAMHAASPVAALSKLTGLSASAIMQLRASGESFAQIATDNGIDPATLVQQIVAARQASLDALVAAGKLTAAQEQAILARITAAVTAMVGHTPGSMPATGTMTPGTPVGPMVPGDGTAATGTMAPGTHSGPMTPDATAPMAPATGPMMVPDSGTATHTPSMTPGSGMNGGSTAPHAGSGMM